MASVNIGGFLAHAACPSQVSEGLWFHLFLILWPHPLRTPSGGYKFLCEMERSHGKLHPDSQSFHQKSNDLCFYYLHSINQNKAHGYT